MFPWLSKNVKCLTKWSTSVAILDITLLYFIRDLRIHLLSFSISPLIRRLLLYGAVARENPGNKQLLILIQEAFGNSWMFPDLKQDGKKPVLNAGTESGPGRGCSRIPGTGNFPDFLVKIWFPGNGIRECRPLKLRPHSPAMT